MLSLRYLISAAMRLDPHTHAFVLCTALMTAVTFAIFAMQVLGVLFGWSG